MLTFNRITCLAVFLCAFNFLTEFSTEVSGAAVPVLLQVKQGLLKGSLGQTRGDRHFAQFLGIPYASKPGRFELAGPAPKWDGTKDATLYGNKCTQYRREAKEIVGSEDCLFINVFTPDFPKDNQIKSKNPLPVLVFIHGGSFLFYSGEVFGPKYLLDEDLILVTFNFRLGALGFLNTEDSSSIANLGLRDQVAALKWIQENIASFGGDPKRVTLFGNSAGSAAVSYHVLSPLSKNLFSGAISQSGTALCPWTMVQSPGKVVKNLGEKLKCSTTSTKDLMACMKTKDLRELIEQQQKIVGTLNPEAPVPFAPSVENVQSSGEYFLPDYPARLLSDGKFNNVPYIIGVNSADGLTYAVANILNKSSVVEQIDQKWDVIAPIILNFGPDVKSSTTQSKEISQKVREFYFGKEKIQPDRQSSMQKFTELMSDRNFFQCTQNTALELARQGAPVFVYYFTEEDGHSFLDHFGTTPVQHLKGVKHQDEIQYFTSSSFFPEIKANSKTFLFSKSIVALWASFAANGKPTKTWGRELTWNSISAADAKSAATNPTKIKWYNLDDTTQLIEVPFASRVKFWNDLPLNSIPVDATTTTTTTTTTKKPGFFGKIFG